MSNNIRYIVFLIDSKFKEHDGNVFSNYNDAYEYARDAINDNYSDKFVIGMFDFDKDKRDMLISGIQTFGFKGDKKNVNQKTLFLGL